MWLITGKKVPEALKSLPHYHLPLIQTEPFPFEPLKFIQDAEALVITSQQTVHLLKPYLGHVDKEVFCVGPATQGLLKTFYKGPLYLPKTYDQEGLLALILHHKPGSVFYPHAEGARPYLKQKLLEHQIQCICCICYKTVIKKAFLPKAKLTGYFFSSPSCIHSFITQFGQPKDLPILVIGQVSYQEAIKCFTFKNRVKILTESFISTPIQV